MTDANQVDTARMMRHLAELARWTKLSGTPDEAESLAYVESQMASFGYAVSRLSHPAYISLPGAARLIIDGKTTTAITHSMSRSSPAEGVTGRVVDLGQGTDADFSRQDVRGAIILVDGIATPSVALRASRAAAIGQIHVSPHEHLHEMCISPVWGSPDTRTAEQLPATVVLTISDRDGKALRNQLRQGSQLTVVLHAEVDTGWRQTPILVADMQAPLADDRTPFILFSGHHDTWYKGVMDNGAANVTMMEVARLSALQQPKWRRNLRFCFWSGHSHGRYSSSSWYADNHWLELERHCAVHVNVDSTGGIGATKLDEASAASELASLAAEVLQAETGQRFSRRRLGRNSDQSFWGIGIPSIFSILSTQADSDTPIRNNLGWWWHTPEDLIDKIDPALLKRDTSIYRTLLSRLLTDTLLPIDLVAQIEDLQRAVRGIDLSEGHGLSLSGLAADIQKLGKLCRSIAFGKSSGDLDYAAIDAVRMRLSRALVPIDYTTGNRFAHDPALPQTAWPALDPVRKFAAIQPSSPSWHPLQIEARRALNLVAHTVSRSIEIAERFAQTR